MDNFFEVPVTWRSSNINFTAELIPYAYSYKIEVDVFGTIISFEPDEERNFRALVNVDHLQEAATVDKELLKEIACQLAIFFKN